MPAASIASRTAERALRRGRDLEDGPVELDVVRPTFGRGQRQLVLVHGLGVDEHDAAPLEQPGDGPGGAEVAAVLRERVPDV